MPQMGKLRRLLVAAVPPMWGIACTRCLLDAAPCLETLHVDDDDGDMARLLSRQPPSSEFKHRRLREVVVSDFEGTPAQVEVPVCGENYKKPPQLGQRFQKTTKKVKNFKSH